jgi:hypothetical protein
MEFEVIRSAEGDYVAACYIEKIFIEASCLEELHEGIESAISERFSSGEKPKASDINLIFYQE